MDPLVFALDESRILATTVAAGMNLELSALEVRLFGYGEHKARPMVDVRNRTVIVIQSLCGDDELSANDRLVRLLFFVGALWEGSAAQVVVVTPYLTYARKDRQTKQRDPVTTRYVAQLFESIGTDRLVAVDVHNRAAFQNAFRITTDHVEAAIPLADHIAGTGGHEPIAVVSPDIGGAKRAKRFADILSRRVGSPVSRSVMEKFRTGGEVSGRTEMLGSVSGRVSIIVDDLIDGGGTMLRAAAACRERGATRVIACATHGAFSPAAVQLFDDDTIDEVIVTDTIAPNRLPSHPSLSVVPLGPWLATALGNIITGGSLDEQLEIDD